MQNLEALDEPQWLIDALQYFHERHVPLLAELINLAGNDGDTDILRLLEAGMEREQHLLVQTEQQQVSVENLERTHDQRNELVYKPYHALGRIVAKFIKNDIGEMPEYDGTRTPEEYAEICKQHIRNELEARYQLVNPFLSPCHRYYVRKQISTKFCSVYTGQRLIALDHLLQQQHPV